eukprot:2575591-Amphidinium_carterae.1
MLLIRQEWVSQVTTFVYNPAGQGVWFAEQGWSVSHMSLDPCTRNSDQLKIEAFVMPSGWGTKEAPFWCGVQAEESARAFQAEVSRLQTMLAAERGHAEVQQSQAHCSPLRTRTTYASAFTQSSFQPSRSDSTLSQATV